MADQIVTGERLQELCDVYCGTDYYFRYNPRITSQTHKHKHIDSIQSEWDNPTLVYCYGDCIRQLYSKLSYFKNKFVLVTHNSDENIREIYKDVLEHPLLVHWFAQNVNYHHPKLSLLPIGIANSMWPHGNIPLLMSKLETIPQEKDNSVYYYFNIGTNYSKRMHCKQEIDKKGLVFGHGLEFASYLNTLAKAKFAISPEGNGIDCHRMWECFYFEVIPIVHRSPFTEILSSILPCIVLDNWSDLDINACYDKYDSLRDELRQRKQYLTLDYYKKSIQSKVDEVVGSCESDENTSE